MKLNNLIIYIKNFLAYLIYSFLNTVIFSSKIAIGNKALLLINSGQIGDLIVSSVILENEQIYDEFDEIFFVIKEEYLEIFKEYKGRVKIIGYCHNKYKYSLCYKINFLRGLRQKRIKICYNLTAARGILNDEMALLSGAQSIFCLNSDWRYLKKMFGKRMDKEYTSIIAKGHLNEYEKHIQVLYHINSVLKIKFSNNLVFRTDLNLIIDMKQDYIVIAPFSSERNRDWAKKNYLKLIELLKDRYRIVLIGAKSQKKDLDELKDTFENVSVLAGQLKLYEIPTLIKNSILFIGLDSGITHIAVRLKIPTIAIIGGGNYGKFFPFKESDQIKYFYSKMDCFGCEWRCELERKYCIDNISVKEIYDKAREILKE